MENLSQKLLDKSIEAFSMAIELYNKPTIRYRVEGFSMFICNAWELMLKAHIIKTEGAQNPKNSLQNNKLTPGAKEF